MAITQGVTGYAQTFAAGTETTLWEVKTNGNLNEQWKIKAGIDSVTFKFYSGDTELASYSLAAGESELIGTTQVSITKITGTRSGATSTATWYPTVIGARRV